jgi:hypothetical protein
MTARVSESTAAWTQQVISAEALREVVELCNAETIDVLPVKGIVTGQLLYDDISERPLSDVDVRVRPESLMPLLVAGKRAGWKVVRVSRTYRNVVFHVGGRMVDVETDVGPPGLCSLTVDTMLARSTYDAALGFEHRVPELHDHALLVCVNVFKDKLVTASAHAVADVERIASLPGFDPVRLAAIAAESDVRSLVWIVADWLWRERGIDPWRAVRNAIGARAPRPFYASIFRRLLEHERGARLPMIVLARAASDSPVRRLEALSRMAACAVELRLR